MKNGLSGLHIAAILVITIWGTTYISTKVLLNNGMSPGSIMFYRFLIAYVCMWIFSREKLCARNPKDEFLMLMAGFCGGTLYFLTENEALKITLASNVSLILCTTPILTVFASRIFLKNVRIHNRMIWGSLMALCGVGLVVYNGRNTLELNPFGDMLTICAALAWAFYTVIIKQLDGRYPIRLITRKVFFYGLLTLMPMFIFEPLDIDPEILSRPVVWSNLLFLGIIASFLCFWSWNFIVKRLGSVTTSNYMYLSPVVTLVTASIILSEQISIVAIVGAAMILSGVYFAGRVVSPIVRT